MDSLCVHAEERIGNVPSAVAPQLAHDRRRRNQPPARPRAGRRVSDLNADPPASDFFQLQGRLRQRHDILVSRFANWPKGNSPASALISASMDWAHANMSRRCSCTSKRGTKDCSRWRCELARPDWTSCPDPANGSLRLTCNGRDRAAPIAAVVQSGRIAAHNGAPGEALEALERLGPRSCPSCGCRRN